MEKELDEVPDPDELIEKMKNNYEKYFGKEFDKSGLTDVEKGYVEELKEKYKSREWTYDKRW